MKCVEKVATALVIAVTVALLITAPARAAERMTPSVVGRGYVWWEGEDAVSHNFGPQGRGPSRAVVGICSGDAWLEADAEEAPAGGLVATWRIQVPETARYDLWARIGYRAWSGNQWRFDDGEWQESPPEEAFRQLVHFARYRPASWVPFKPVELEAGLHTFQVRFPEGQGVHQGFDCFVLATRPFVPLGKFRPDQRIPVEELAPEAAREGWWPFQPSWRPGQERVVDMSFMNHPIGAHGFVTMKGGELFFQDGTPIRFWGMNVNYWQGRMVFCSHRDAELLADHLSRLGVNCVRLHIMHSTNSLIDKTRDDTRHFDQRKLDRLDYLAYALRKRGIYVNLDMMYHRMFKEGDNIDPELVGTEREGDYNVNWAAGSAALFHPRAIELNRALYKKLLQHVNPYTGMRWLDDPQLAVVTVQNEQSIFWGTTNIHRGRPREILNQMYTAWLREKYGSHEHLAEAWQVAGQRPNGSPGRPPFAEGENLDTGIIELGRVGAQSVPHLRKRGIDQLRFLYHVETSFYEGAIGAMREWGVKCPIITSNWRGAGQTTRLVLQASRLGEIVDRHYYSGNALLLEQIGRGTVGAAFDQQAGRAFSVSEWNANTRGRYTPEAVPLIATVAAFQGWDAMWQFSTGTPMWETALSGITPGHYALYPAAAAIFRRGDIRPGELVYERRRSPEYQFSFEPEKQLVPSELIAVGRIQNAYVDEPTPSLLRNEMVTRLWDKEQGVVSANTGEFDWHYDDVWLRLNSARTQGAFGALSGVHVECDQVRVQTPNEFCAVIATSMDEKPIGESGHVLVSAVGRSRGLPAPEAPQGPVEGRAATMPPCLMEPVMGSVSVRTGLDRVYAVDLSGYRTEQVPCRREGDWLIFRMEGKPRVLYYEVTR